jgi:hypothetical protein
MPYFHILPTSTSHVNPLVPKVHTMLPAFPLVSVPGRLDDMAVWEYLNSDSQIQPHKKGNPSGKQGHNFKDAPSFKQLPCLCSYWKNITCNPTGRALLMGISLCTWSLWECFFSQHLGLLLE